MNKNKYILIILLASLIQWNCKRDNLETLVEAEFYNFDTRKPLKNVPLVVKSTYRDKKPGASSSYRIDTFYTDSDGKVSFIYHTSEKSGYQYTVNVIEGDSNAPWREDQEEVLIPGYPKFISQSLDGRIDFYVKINHTDPVSKNFLRVTTMASERPGTRLLSTDFQLEGQDTVLHFSALKRHVLTVVLKFERWGKLPDGKMGYYTVNNISKYYTDPANLQPMPSISF
jgi:hypothetical protein